MPTGWDPADGFMTHSRFLHPPCPRWGKNLWALNPAIVWPKSFRHNINSLAVLMPPEHKREITFPAKRISSPSDQALTGNVSVTRLQPDLPFTSSWRSSMPQIGSQTRREDKIGLTSTRQYYRPQFLHILGYHFSPEGWGQHQTARHDRSMPLNAALSLSYVEMLPQHGTLFTEPTMDISTGETSPLSILLCFS